MNVTAARRNVVIVRAGLNSLHHGWLDLPYEQRNFDIIVSYFNQEAYDRHSAEDGVHAFFCPGGKWDGLFKTLSWMKSSFAEYDYYWLPDDDIAAEAQSINALFEVMARDRLAVAQPSLTADSYFTHFIFINCPKARLRYSNYIEIMVPCLARDVLEAMLPHFNNSMSGFGLDYIWCRLPILGQRRAAIIDEIQVRHTRPVGNVLMSAMAKKGLSPKAEEEALKQIYGVNKRVTPLVYEMLMSSGRVVHGRVRTGFAMACCHLGRVFARRGAAAKDYGLRKVVQLLRRQLTRSLDMTPLRMG